MPMRKAPTSPTHDAITTTSLTEGPRPPSVLVVHERYRQAGGEDAVVEAECRLLTERGYRVERLTIDNERIDERAGKRAQLRLAAGTVWSFAAANVVRRLIARTRPDIMHVHNFLPLLSPSILAAAHEAGVGVVQTLHNYRLVCPVATLFRDGRPCEDCVGRSVAWPAVLHACYRSSKLASGVVATMLATNRARGTWSRDVDVYVAVSAFIRGRMIAGGLPKDRIIVKGNFVGSRRDPIGDGSSDDRRPSAAGMLFVGRLTTEKGADLLLETWRRHDNLPPLEIVGDGPLATQISDDAAQMPRVQVAGLLDRAAVRERMDTARALVFPSRWYEGQPVTILEAFAAGLPVIAPNIGSIPELVDDGRTGLLFAPGDPDDLARAVGWAASNDSQMREMGANARSEYERLHTPEANYGQLTAIYAQALSRHRAQHAS